MGVKFWIIRVILGIVLGFGAVFVVEVGLLGFVVLVFGGLDEYLNRQHPRGEMQLQFMIAMATGGASAAAMAASFLGVLMAPVIYESHRILRSWAMAAALGGFAGAAVGAAISFLHPGFLELGWTALAVLACGVVAGLASAIVLRVRVNR